MKKILFIIPDGVGIRNYLFSDLLHLLQERNWEIGFLHALSPQAIEEIKKVHPGLNVREFSFYPYNEGIVNKFLRESVSYARLIHNTRLTGNPTVRSMWRPAKKGKKKYFYALAESFGKRLSRNYKHILKTEQFYWNRLKKRKNPYTALFREWTPDIILNLHQRAPLAIEPVLAARRADIPTAQVIYSWDNLPKARLTVRTDEYLVWSEYMKDEMRLYYPEIPEDHVHITGTPQFEFYYKSGLIWDKKDFYARHRIPMNKKIVVYSGGDTRTSPYDQLYVDEIARQISRMPRDERPVLLVRPTPIDPADRYKEVIEKWPDIVRLSLPRWHRDKHWSKSFPTFADVELLVNTVIYSEAVINVGSTMALDFATHDKPAIYIDFNIKNDGDWDIKRVNQFQHFRSMDGLDPVFYWREPGELPGLLQRVFHGEKKPGARPWFLRINNYPEDASERIVRYLTGKTR